VSLRCDGAQLCGFAAAAADRSEAEAWRLAAPARQSACAIFEPFKDGEQLLAECGPRGLEGIVSKRKQAPYRSGKCDWVKVKCAQWREDNKDRGDLFMR
jgi:ATP-dependent DNA ligase